MGEQQFPEERGMPPDPCAGERGAEAAPTGAVPSRACTHRSRSLPQPFPPRLPEQGVPRVAESLFLSLSLPAGADALITAHDFLSWIKQEEEPCVREPWELPEREMLPPGPGPGERPPPWGWGGGGTRPQDEL